MNHFRRLPHSFIIIIIILKEIRVTINKPSPLKILSLSYFSVSMEVPKFLSIFMLIAYLWVISNNNGVEASHKIYPEFQSLAAVKVKQLHRTAFHFQPPKHWINGIWLVVLYHCFFQPKKKTKKQQNLLFLKKIFLVMDLICLRFWIPIKAIVFFKNSFVIGLILAPLYI